MRNKSKFRGPKGAVMPKLTVYTISTLLALGLASGPASSQNAGNPGTGPNPAAVNDDARNNAPDKNTSTAPETTGTTKTENNDKSDKMGLQRPGGNTTTDESGHRCKLGTPDEKNCNPVQ
jgi:hypothetical protein